MAPFRPYCEIPDCYSETYVHFRDSHMCKTHALAEMLKDLTHAQINDLLVDVGYKSDTEKTEDPADALPATERYYVQAYHIQCRYCGCKYIQRNTGLAIQPPQVCKDCGQDKIQATPLGQTEE